MLSRRLAMTSLLLLPAAARAQAPAAPARPAVLTGARVIDGKGAAPLGGVTLVLDGGRIAWIGTGAPPAPPPGAETVDCAGKTIMPGLISAHSHIGVVDGLTAGADNYNRANIMRQLRQFETYGVTTIASLGLNRPLFYELRAEQRAARAQGADFPGADILGADRGIGVTGGAPPAAVVSLAEDQIYLPATAEAARAAVREMAARGTDLVKVWLDDFGGAVPVKVSPEVYQAVIDEAHRNNLRVAAHIHDIDDAVSMVRAGVDILAHGVRDRPVTEELASLMRARGTWYIATLALDDSTFAFAERPPWLADPFVQRALHPDVRAQFQDQAWAARTLASPGAARARASLAMNKRNLKTLHEAGVRIGFGTDSGVGLRIPGLAEHRELALMVEAGLTPRQALAIATSGSAALLGLEDRGVLAAGRLADLVVLDADPDAGIANTTRIQSVWHRGRRVAS